MKKVLSLVLAVVMVLGMTTAAFAADATYSKGDLYLGLSGKNPDLDEIRPDDEVRLYILRKSDDKGVTKAEIKDSKITAKVKASSGSAVLDKTEIKYENGLAYVNVVFKEVYATTKDIDYEYTVYLQYNKTRDSDSDYDLIGTFANEIQEIDEDDEYVYVGDVPVVKALDYNKKIEVDLGSGVSIFARMFEDKKYYGYVSQEIKDEDAEVTSQYPDIDTVYYLSTIGLSGSGDVVKFDLDDNMYVYTKDENGSLVYLGRSNTLVPYYTRYYLAVKELNVASTTTPNDDDDNNDDIPTPGNDGTTGNSDTGGDDVPENVNDNPGTGC